MSKPKKENKSYYTSEQLAQVEALAAHGHTLEAIAKYLGVSTRTIFYAKLQNKELEAAYERGKFKAQSFVAKGLFSFINQEENTPAKLSAIIFYLKTQCKWSTDHNSITKLKFDISEAKTPSEIINNVLTGLQQGELNLQQAQQIANLATTKLNIELSTSIETTSAIEKESEEQLMDKIYTLRKVIEHEEKKNKEN